MLTAVTAARTSRDIEVAAPRRTVVEVQLLLFRRLKDTAIHEAKRTRDGLPTRLALLERAWIEEYSAPGSPNWQTSFANCCKMLDEDAGEERSKALREIERAWRKAVTDWARKRTQQRMEVIAELKAQENPAWSARRALQDELPLEDHEDESSKGSKKGTIQ
jgi:hypothetical protein